MHLFNQIQPDRLDRSRIAAYGREVGCDILERAAFGDQIALDRPEGGQVTALSGDCSHRSFPLARAGWSVALCNAHRLAAEQPQPMQ